MDKYLQLKLVNEFNEKMTIRIDNFDENKTDDEIDKQLTKIVESGALTGKSGVFNKKLEADIVSVERKQVVLK